MQHAIYDSLNEFMVKVGYQQASDRREDDPVWSTLNDNNYRAMMEYKFGVPRREIRVPTTKESIHQAILEHEAFVWLGDAPEQEQSGGESDSGKQNGGEGEASTEASQPQAPVAPEVATEIVDQFEQEQTQQSAEGSSEPAQEDGEGAPEGDLQQDGSAEEGGDESEQE